MRCTILVILLTTQTMAADLTTYAMDDESNDIISFKNGTVIKLDGESYKGGYTGYIGYISYNEEAVFIGDKICLKGKSFYYDLYKTGNTYNYSNRDYYGAQAYSKVEELCGSLDILK